MPYGLYILRDTQQVFIELNDNMNYKLGEEVSVG